MKLTFRDDIAFGTNILKVKVPKHLLNKFKCGIEWIDSAMGGEGFTPSSVTLFTGTPGAGKTTMILKIADSVTKNGGIALFNTAEESLYQVSMVAKRLQLRNGFLVGATNNVVELLENAEKIMKKRGNKKKQFFLLVDSLQCMDDGKYSNGLLTSGTAIRCLQLITDWCKEHHACAIIINQVNKQGKMSGSNKLKHMVDAHMHLGVEVKEEELKGCRVLETQKNRFGGCGHIFFLSIHKTGFTEVARVSAS